ncbi:MAG: 3-deoxy-manno-octulosonate cytidylyltransferase [Polaromonas sp.]|jgi:3-deoxy-manno-octulosonate cytidylyltransferase (CMP-KDO synthetase)|nr:3-deoxy-manno-octulosonate cytidylyltransferase [Polaromonas sp.]MBK7026863.1 3-deoxy-manno-octulosonate cytidylyltransferase [Polaromonas sp.]
MNRTNLTVLIPARLGSSRLPNKPLADVAGLPLIVRVAQRVMAGTTARVVVACDDDSISMVCQQHHIEVVLTRADHPSGSDRLAEACDILQLPDDAIVVNVQGDEPLIDPDLILQVAKVLQNQPLASMSTAAHAIESVDDYRNPNVVKVVLDAQNLALYFSRAPIAWWRDGAKQGVPELPVTPRALRHIGIYAYRVGFLKQFPMLPQAEIEVCEALEQLRAMWYGHRIAVHVTDKAPGAGVDTPEDLARVRIVFAPNKAN